MKRILFCLALVIFCVNLVHPQNLKINDRIVGQDHYVLSNGLKVYLWEKHQKQGPSTNGQFLKRGTCASI
jgi:hypothetical protein